MQEKTAKWSFWALAAATLALSCIPSTILLGALQRYRRFVSGFDPGVLRASSFHSIPHQGGRGSPSEPSSFEFVEFKLRAPKAKEVYLVGEFNAWKSGSMALAKQAGGVWGISLPLPPGRYHYRFIVDGTPRADPQNQSSEIAGGELASIKEVH